MKIDLSKYPADMPWGPIAVLSLAGAFVSAGLIFHDLTREKWAVPPQNDIQYVNGKFLPRLPGQAYVFRGENGGMLSFGCEPQGFGVSCFDDDGLRAAEQENVKVGYFYVYNLQRPRLSAVLVSVSSGDRTLLSYSERRQEMEVWARREYGLGLILLRIAAGLIPAIVSLGLSLAVFRSRMNRYKQQGPWAEA